MLARRNNPDVVESVIRINSLRFQLRLVYYAEFDRDLTPFREQFRKLVYSLGHLLHLIIKIQPDVLKCIFR